jgi:hypothetical protein
VKETVICFCSLSSGAHLALEILSSHILEWYNSAGEISDGSDQCSSPTKDMLMIVDAH